METADEFKAKFEACQKEMPEKKPAGTTPTTVSATPPPTPPCSVSDPYSWNPDPAENLNPVPDGSKLLLYDL